MGVVLFCVRSISESSVDLAVLKLIEAYLALAWLSSTPLTTSVFVNHMMCVFVLAWFHNHIFSTRSSAFASDKLFEMCLKL